MAIKKLTADDCTSLIRRIISIKMNIEAVQILYEVIDVTDYILSSSYETVIFNLGGLESESLFRDLIIAINEYFLHEEKLNTNSQQGAQNYVAIFENFENRMRDADAVPHGIGTRGMYRILCESAILAKENIDSAAFKDSLSKKGGQTDYVWALDGCLKLLSEGDRLLRRSSDEYKEIQAEITLLKKFIKAESFGSTIVGSHFVEIMLNVLIDKVSEHLKGIEETDMLYSTDSLDSLRIDNMHKVLGRLRILAKAKKKELLTSLLTDNQKRQLLDLLGYALKNITFSARIVSEIICMQHELPDINRSNNKTYNNYSNYIDHLNTIKGSLTSDSYQNNMTLMVTNEIKMDHAARVKHRMKVGTVAAMAKAFANQKVTYADVLETAKNIKERIEDDIRFLYHKENLTGADIALIKDMYNRVSEQKGYYDLNSNNKINTNSQDLPKNVLESRYAAITLIYIRLDNLNRIMTKHHLLPEPTDIYCLVKENVSYNFRDEADRVKKSYTR